jgi:hypothetical protein
MSSKFAPILLFAYKRLDVLKQTVSALQDNFGAADTELFIFSDAPKSERDKSEVLLVRDYVRTISGFKNVVITESTVSKGLANSIIEGVSKVIRTYGKVIVLEDDLITSRNFLCFMNCALEYYETNQHIFSISGYTFPFKKPLNYKYDNYIITRGSSWGWASWQDRWETVDWAVTDYDQFLSNRNIRKKFSESGSDLVDMLKRQMSGKMDSWAIRWWYQQSKQNQFTAYPVISKVLNNGFDKDATHTTNYNRYKTILDQSNNCEFNFEPTGFKNAYYQKRIQQKFSIPTRIVFGTVMSFIKKLTS